MTALNLTTVEIKAFVPAKDFAQSIAFYQALGFTKAFETAEIAYFHHGQCSFLLQNFYVQPLAENFMMHLVVEDVDQWYLHVEAQGLRERFGVNIMPPQNQPWAMRDFVLIDPSGVLWRIAQNLPE